MKRLGETAVSPDGKWLAYSVTTVNLAQNTKTPELWLQAIAGGEPQKLAVAQPGDSGVQFAPDGKRILFLSGREGGQQVWLADFDRGDGRGEQREEADGDCDRGRQREVVAGRPLRGFHFCGISRLSSNHGGGLRERATSATRIATRRWPRAR